MKEAICRHQQLQFICFPADFQRMVACGGTDTDSTLGLLVIHTRSLHPLGAVKAMLTCAVWSKVIYSSICSSS